jgi:Mg/Co/Ni transporter MgtE
MFVLKELLMALSLSGVVGVFGWVRVSLFGSILHLELISIVVALVLIVLISIVIGALLPLLFDTVGLDPANTSTTIQVIMDISGVLITCLVAAVLLDSSLTMVSTTTTLGSSA